MSELFYKVENALIEFERLNGEVIVVSFKSGKYFSLSGSAADVWTLMINASSVRHIVEKLKLIWGLEIDIAPDIDDFINKCLNEELISASLEGENNEFEIPNDFVRDGWIKPELMIFGNLQDLIMVDPVHDASLINWPVQKGFEFDQ